MPRKVVLGPDVLIAAFYDARARAILNQWRDGEILPIVTRDLLMLYVRTLNAAGLNAELIRQWSLWLTAPGKTLYLENAAPNLTHGLTLCREIAAQNNCALLTLSSVE